MSISVCMIVRNEEQLLRAALESIPVGYEVIVVDTGSQDGTVEVARSYGARLFHCPWTGDFSDARNESIRHATGSFILVIDADERLTRSTGEQIEQFIEQNPNECASIIIRNHIAEEVHVSRMLRFFPNDSAYRFAEPVHERLTYLGNPVEGVASSIVIDHFGYEPDYYKAKNKAERYFSLYEGKLYQQPGDGYTWYQLGKLHFSLNQYEQAVDAFQRCVHIQEEHLTYFPVMIVMMGYALKELKRSDVAAQLLGHYAALYPRFPDLPFLQGLVGMETGNLHEIESGFLRALSIGETDQYSSVQGVGSFKAEYNLGIFYEITGRSTEAAEYYERSSLAGYSPAIQRLKALTNKA